MESSYHPVFITLAGALGYWFIVQATQLWSSQCIYTCAINYRAVTRLFQFRAYYPLCLPFPASWSACDHRARLLSNPVFLLPVTARPEMDHPQEFLRVAWIILGFKDQVWGSD